MRNPDVWKRASRMRCLCGAINLAPGSILWRGQSGHTFVYPVFLWNTTENVFSSAACPPSWRTLSDTNSINGRRIDAVNTVGSCQSYCVDLPSCVAVDFNYGERSCWVHVDPADLYPDNVYQQLGTDQLRINRTCTDQVTTVSTGLCLEYRVCSVTRERGVHPVAYLRGHGAMPPLSRP